MKKLSKKAIFEMVKNGAIKADNLALQNVWDTLLKNCDSLNELKAELSEAKSEFDCYKIQIDSNNANLWYLGQKISNNGNTRVVVRQTLEALDSVAKVLGYKFDRHFLISLKNINMNTIKRQRDGVKLTKYLTRNGYTFYRDAIGKRFKTLDGIVFTPYN